MASLSNPIQEEETYYEVNPQLLGGRETINSTINPILQPPQSGTVFQNVDDPFFKWLLDHKARTIPPLKMAWRGLEWSSKQNEWISIGIEGKNGEAQGRIMNEIGITWAASLLESYFSPVFLATNMSVKNYNFRMRTASRFILMTLHERFKEFDLLQSNIDRAAEEIESKISALLAGAINDGYRKMIITQIHIQENKMYGMSPQQAGGMAGIFSRPQIPQPQGAY